MPINDLAAGMSRLHPTCSHNSSNRGGLRDLRDARFLFWRERPGHAYAALVGVGWARDSASSLLRQPCGGGQGTPH